MDEISSLYQLVYTIGEMLTMTWPGHLILGMVIGSVLAKLCQS